MNDYIIDESVLRDYFHGELTHAEEEKVREWSRVSEDNGRLFGDMQQQFLRVRWGVEASQIKVDYADISGRIGAKTATLKRRSRRGLVAAIVIPAAAAVIMAVIFLNPVGTPADFMSQVAPAEHRAVIQLSDGTRHVVDMGESELTEANGTRLSISGGEIAYHDDGAIAEGVHNTVTVSRGADYFRIKLGDGTAVWLNSDSRLEYPLNFSGGERRVYLSGEAYFDVARDENRPFVVESGNHSVAVLGTEFNVSAYSGENAVTTLVEGSVAVHPGQNERRILSPGQQATYDFSSDGIAVRDVEVGSFVSWKDGEISVERIPFAQILTKLSRRFDVVFDLSDARETSDIVLTGSIPANEDFRTILSILEKAANVEFKPQKNGDIKVTRN